MSDDYKKPYVEKNDLIKTRKESEFGEDMGSAWENIKKGLGLNEEKEAERLALNRKMKKLGVWGNWND